MPTDSAKSPIMPGRVSRYLAADHERLDALLQRADGDHAAYLEFRAGLLRHIAMEEKILLPAAQRARRDDPLPAAGRLRLDHGALAALLVPSPTPKILAAIRAILAPHNVLEEAPGGVYETCETLAGAEADRLAAQLQATAPVRTHANVDGPRIMEAARRALARAGYDCDLT